MSALNASTGAREVKVNVSGTGEANDKAQKNDKRRTSDSASQDPIQQAKDLAQDAVDKARGVAEKGLSTAAQVASAFATAGLEMGQAIAKAASRSAGAVKDIWGNNDDTDTTKRN